MGLASSCHASGPGGDRRNTAGSVTHSKPPKTSTAGTGYSQSLRACSHFLVMDFHWVIHSQAASCHAPWAGSSALAGKERDSQDRCSVCVGDSHAWGLSWDRAESAGLRETLVIGSQMWVRSGAISPQALLSILQQWHCCPDLLVHAGAIAGIGIHCSEVNQQHRSVPLSACSPMAGNSTALETVSWEWRDLPVLGEWGTRPRGEGNELLTYMQHTCSWSLYSIPQCFIQSNLNVLSSDALITSQFAFFHMKLRRNFPSLSIP